MEDVILTIFVFLIILFVIYILISKYKYYKKLEKYLEENYKRNCRNCEHRDYFGGFTLSFKECYCKDGTLKKLTDVCSCHEFDYKIIKEAEFRMEKEEKNENFKNSCKKNIF